MATLLQENREETYTGAEIARELEFGKKERNTLYADLKRLEEKGLIEKVPPKHWRAACLNGTGAAP